MTSRTHTDLEQLYESRCGPNADYRRAVWGVLVSDFFSRFIAPDAAVLDLGCGYGDFINAVQARTRLAMDLNPSSQGQTRRWCSVLPPGRLGTVAWHTGELP